MIIFAYHIDTPLGLWPTPNHAINPSILMSKQCQDFKKALVKYQLVKFNVICHNTPPFPHHCTGIKAISKGH